MKDDYHSSGCKQREVGELVYAAQCRARERRVITRLEYGEQGNNPRYAVTNLSLALCADNALLMPAQRPINVNPTVQ